MVYFRMVKNENTNVSSRCFRRKNIYWSKILGKKKLVAKQLSQRGGTLKCEHIGDKVKISGKAKLSFKGEIYLD